MSTEKTRVQQALRDLRKQLNLTQQGLAVALGVASISVARWETSRPPSGYSLLQLVNFARGNNLLEIAEVFQTAIYRENPERYLLMGRKPQRAALSALEEIHGNTEVPEFRREYIKILYTLERVHARMLESFAPESTGYRDWQRTHLDLQWEIRDEEKRTKKKQGR